MSYTLFITYIYYLIVFIYNVIENTIVFNTMYIDITIRPVLKHGPRSSTEVQVLS